MDELNIQTIRGKMTNRIIVENVAACSEVPEDLLIKMATWIFKSENLPAWNMTCIFVDDDFIVDLNNRFFQKTMPTDVISFNLSDAEEELEGEVYISTETARMNAGEYDVALENELLRLVAHGVYHLLGYDDATHAEKQQMTILENKALEYIYSTL